MMMIMMMIAIIGSTTKNPSTIRETRVKAGNSSIKFGMQIFRKVSMRMSSASVDGHYDGAVTERVIPRNAVSSPIDFSFDSPSLRIY